MSSIPTSVTLVFSLSLLLESIGDFVINFFSTLNMILLGGVLPLIESKFLSLIQSSVGPNQIGYKGSLQFMADALKVFLKDFIYLNNSNKYAFFLLPLMFFYVNLSLVYLVYFNNNVFLFDINYSVVYMFTILFMSNVIIFLCGLVSNNKFSTLASMRVLVYIFSLDMLLTLLFLFLIFFCGSLALFNLAHHNFNEGVGFNFDSILFVPILFILFLVDSNKAPYDVFEAESELVMGYSIEYSGFLFGVFVLTEYLHTYLFSFLISSLFF